MTDVVMVAPEIPIGDLLHIIRLARRELRRVEKSHERSTFVPEPGRRDDDVVKIERLTAMIERLEAYL